jgi:hypothetical protein
MLEHPFLFVEFKCEFEFLFEYFFKKSETFPFPLPYFPVSLRSPPCEVWRATLSFSTQFARRPVALQLGLASGPWRPSFAPRCPLPPIGGPRLLPPTSSRSPNGRGPWPWDVPHARAPGLGPARLGDSPALWRPPPCTAPPFPRKSLTLQLYSAATNLSCATVLHPLRRRLFGVEEPPRSTAWMRGVAGAVCSRHRPLRCQYNLTGVRRREAPPRRAVHRRRRP